MKQRKPREVILEACVKFYREEQRKEGYSNRIEIDKPDIQRERLEHEACRVIESELPSELRQIYGLETKTQVIAIRDGSLLIFFSVVVTGMGVFASYSDFFESIALVKKHVGMLLERAIRPLVQLQTDVSVSTEFPRMPDPDDIFWPRRLRRRMGPFAEELLDSGFPWAVRPPVAKRDGFFWWLLIVNLVLLTILGVLVGGAVMKTYFPEKNEIVQQDGATVTVKAAPGASGPVR